MNVSDLLVELWGAAPTLAQARSTRRVVAGLVATGRIRRDRAGQMCNASIPAEEFHWPVRRGAGRPALELLRAAGQVGRRGPLPDHERRTNLGPSTPRSTGAERLAVLVDDRPTAWRGRRVHRAMGFALPGRGLWGRPTARVFELGRKGVRPSITKPTTEFVLAGSRVANGRPMKLADEGVSQVVLAPRGEHSEKPDEVMARIERLYPDARRLELFARRRRDGWEAWGNEV